LIDNRNDPRDGILAAAKRCYLSAGISATGMKEVAREAGIARSTLYRYFPGRDDLLVATIKREMEALNQKIRSKMDSLHDPADLVVEGLMPRRRTAGPVG
jgi:AcrR family transcriptional regulator